MAVMVRVRDLGQTKNEFALYGKLYIYIEGITVNLKYNMGILIISYSGRGGAGN